MTSNAKSNSEQEDFSLMLGGPFYQALRRLRLSGNALESPVRRAVAICTIAWVPLLILAFSSGKATGNSPVPFIRDYAVHIRFLVAVPLMLVAEVVIHRRMRLLRHEFDKRKLIPENFRTRFDEIIRSAFALRNSLFAEGAIAAFVYIVGVHYIWRPYATIDGSTWYTSTADGSTGLNAAGFWYGYVSIPFFQFLFLRWYYRIFIWSRFLWQVSRIPLRLDALHPDKVGGLGFLSEIVSSFAPLSMMHGAVLSGLIANMIFHTGGHLQDYKVQIVLVVAMVWIILLFPFLFFIGQLMDVKRKGVQQYGELGSAYVDAFKAKWLENDTPKKDDLIGTSDIQSLADLSNSYEAMSKMRITPISRENLVLLAVTTLAPLVPLLLTMMPLEELLKALLGVIA
ncbi:MAG TPA: hypothetical protein PLQ93_11415 [Bacteroidia bacterium]|nr:hypothetical protein [Bacteroidia bacterium]